MISYNIFLACRWLEQSDQLWKVTIQFLFGSIHKVKNSSKGNGLWYRGSLNFTSKFYE